MVGGQTDANQSTRPHHPLPAARCPLGSFQFFLLAIFPLVQDAALCQDLRIRHAKEECYEKVCNGRGAGDWRPAGRM
jgi:hypothetical protein